MDNFAADFTINNDEPLEVEYTLEPSETFDCSFEIYAGGVVWGNIDGDINNQTDLINLLNTKVDLTSFEELSTTVTNNYNELTGDIADLTTTVTDNYNTLSGQISDLTGVVNDNYTSLDNRLTTAEGSILDLTDTVNDNYTELNDKITDNTDDITTIQNTINSYGDIVSYNAAYFATANQGALADTALQPNDNISELVNNVGYITSASLPTVNNGTLDIQVNGTSVGTFTANQSGNTTANIVVPDSATWGNITGTLSNQTDLQTALNSKYDASNPDGYITSADLPTNYVTTNTVQNISGRKTFLGEKAIYFKQNAATDKLGFTLYSSNNTELGALEYRPNTINGNALLALNCSQSGSNYVGFRYWSGINIVAPRPTTNGIYYIPVNITDGTNTVTANNNGTLNISTLLPDVSDMATQTWVTSQGYITSSALTNYVTTNTNQSISGTKTFGTISVANITNTSNSTILRTYAGNTEVGTTNTSLLLKSNLERPYFNNISNTLALSSDIPTVNNGTLDIQVNGTSVGTFTANQSGNTTANIVVPDSATWGNITGTLSNQTDLQTALDAKQNTISDLSTIRSGATLGVTALQPNDNITELVNNAGYITGITSSDVTTALGYTPYNSTNPSGYITTSALNGYATQTWVTSQNYVNGTTLTNTLADYALLTDIPTVNNGTLTIQKNGTTVGTFTANDTNNVTANISVPTSISDLTDDTATYPIDKAESVVDNNSGNLKFWSGTKAQYDAIVTKDANTLYNITDDATPSAYQAYTKSEVDTLIANAVNDALYYKAGDTYTQVAGGNESAENSWSGFLTTNATELRFTMILPKSTKNVSTATISVLKVVARGVMGYLNSASTLDLTSLGTVSAKIFDNRLNIKCVMSTAFTNVQNNSPVSIAIRGITVTFS